MTVLASAIIDRVRTQLIDERVTQRWGDEELLRWLSDGQRTVVAMSPSLGEVTESLQLTEGTKQTLPAGTLMLLDIQRNMGADGETPGRAVRPVTRELMDGMNPSWHAAARSSTISNYIYDPQRPRVYYVYPPSTGLTYLEVSRAANPAEITTTTDLLVVDDLYQTALFDYVMFRAHQKDSDYAAGEGKAQVYLQLFMAFMGQHEGAKLAESPNQQLADTNLGVKGAAK